jgi:hypothetical protein
VMRMAGVLVVAVLAFGLVACGDEEQDEQNHRELVEAANAICDKYEKRAEEIEEPRNLRSSEQAAAFFGELAPLFEAAEIDFRALDPNDEDEDEWNAYVRKVREGRDIANRVANKSLKGDRSYINDLDELERLDRESDELARNVGANGCVGG